MRSTLEARPCTQRPSCSTSVSPVTTPVLSPLWRGRHIPELLQNSRKPASLADVHPRMERKRRNMSLLTLWVLDREGIRCRHADAMEYQETEFDFGVSDDEDHRKLSRRICAEQAAGVYRGLVDHRGPIRLDLNREQHLSCEGTLWVPCNTVISPQVKTTHKIRLERRSAVDPVLRVGN